MQGILLLLIVGHLDSLLMAPMTSPSLSLTAKGVHCCSVLLSTVYSCISLCFGISVDYLCFLPQL